MQRAGVVLGCRTGTGGDAHRPQGLVMLCPVSLAQGMSDRLSQSCCWILLCSAAALNGMYVTQRGWQHPGCFTLAGLPAWVPS